MFCNELGRLFKSAVVPKASTDQRHKTKLEINSLMPSNLNSIPENNNCGTNKSGAIVIATLEFFAKVETSNPNEDDETIVKKQTNNVSKYQDEKTPLVGTSPTKRQKKETNNI